MNCLTTCIRLWVHVSIIGKPFLVITWFGGNAILVPDVYLWSWKVSKPKWQLLSLQGLLGLLVDGPNRWTGWKEHCKNSLFLPFASQLLFTPYVVNHPSSVENKTEWFNGSCSVSLFIPFSCTILTKGCSLMIISPKNITVITGCAGEP